ncbi:hypothetical protein [Actinophytocola gossypii]|uniref:Uncharacterized protein n=1 Tax=Actinophytocola gossypii TaxID=2812003 RepID=A0ABT2J813_9PSEU|nr:hypothetical protein [Actinophytocola gossypii]MCT2583744.1 hypothetical protein [Actinophytocola gossypii]
MASGARRTNGTAPRCESRRHDEAGPAPVVPGLRICADCRDRIEDELVALPALFEMCAYMLDPRPHHLMRERVSGHRPRGIALREAVVTVRTEIFGVLASWCSLVSNEREVPGPDELAVRKLASFLAIHLHWLCAHPAAPDLVDELTDLANAVSEALRPNAGFRVAVGECLHPGCDRTVHAEAHREGGEPYEVSCEAGHVWAPEHWLSLWAQQNRSRNGEKDASKRAPEGAE